MAKKQVVIYVDDFTGDVIKPGQNRSIAFAVDGVEYEIDVTPARAKKFHDFLSPYVRHARRVGGRRRIGGSEPARRDAIQTKAIRAWANANGFQVSDRGRIPTDVELAYNSAH